MLLELRRDAATRIASREAELFYVTVASPTRIGPARWIQCAVLKRVPIGGASDHLVSEASCFSDLDGNDVEINNHALPTFSL